MSVPVLAVLLAALFAAPSVFALVAPDRFKDAAVKFPRSNMWGYILVGIATVWFLYYVKEENIADFAHLKRYMLIGFGALGIGVCLYVKDYIAARGLACVLLLLAKFTLDTVRWIDSDFRIVFQIWAYVWIVAGIWITVSPWRLRDALQWLVSSDARLRNVNAAKVAFCVVVVVVGLFAS